MRKRMLLLLVLATVLSLSATGPAGAGGDDAYDCGLLAVSDTGDPECAEDAEQAGTPTAPSCRFGVEAVFWAGADWVRLSRALSRALEADPWWCGAYSVSIPPLAAAKTQLRAPQDDIVRGLGITPLAEFNLLATTGWEDWIRDNAKTWFEAGVEFRRRMAAAGYDADPAHGETWLLNELDYDAILDAERRADIAELLAGLYYGDVGMQPLPGIVLLAISFRQQNIPDVAGYRNDLQGFLDDPLFWSAVDRYARWFGVQAYPDARLWGVGASSRNERRRHLDDYMFHLLELARSGPASTAVARDVLERKFLPLGNAVWRALGGEQVPNAFSGGSGNTIIDDVQMRQFVSEQVHAIRFHAGSHPQGAPSGRIGFAWNPCNRLSAELPACRAQTPAFVAGLDAIAARIAESVHYAYRQGGASPVGACAPPDTEIDWCTGSVAGAAFTDAWSRFVWSQQGLQ